MKIKLFILLAGSSILLTAKGFSQSSQLVKCIVAKYQAVKGDDKYELILAFPTSGEKMNEKSFVFNVYGYDKEKSGYKLGLVSTGVVKPLNPKESYEYQNVKFEIINGPLKGDIFMIYKGVEAIRIQDADVFINGDLGDNHLYANFFKDFAPNGSKNYDARANYRASTLSTKIGSNQ